MYRGCFGKSWPLTLRMRKSPFPPFLPFLLLPCLNGSLSHDSCPCCCGGCLYGHKGGKSNQSIKSQMTAGMTAVMTAGMTRRKECKTGHDAKWPLICRMAQVDQPSMSTFSLVGIEQVSFPFLSVDLPSSSSSSLLFPLNHSPRIMGLTFDSRLFFPSVSI